MNQMKHLSLSKVMAASVIFVTVSILVTVTPGYSESWTDNWSINGIPLAKFKEAKGADYLELAAGAGTSLLVHWLGHVAWLEASGKPWHQDGLDEVCDEPLVGAQAAMFGRAGFIAQLAVGTVLKFTDLNNGTFATGYHLGTFGEVASYPAIHGYEQGDLGMIDKGSNAMIAHFVLTGWATALLIDFE
jgi:hypothetical protein